MAKETTYAGVLGELSRFSSALAAKAADLPFLEGTRAKLDRMLAEAFQVAREQAALTAEKQVVSKKLQTLVVETQRLATGIRTLLKEHYGIRSEQLVEFGLQPFRGRPFRSRRRTVKPGTPEAPQPPTPPASDPAADLNPKP